jgi:hypothetical protein
MDTADQEPSSPYLGRGQHQEVVSCDPRRSVTYHVVDGVTLKAFGIIAAWQPRARNKMKSKALLLPAYRVKSWTMGITARLKQRKDGKVGWAGKFISCTASSAPSG